MIRDDEDIAVYREAAAGFPDDKHRTDKRGGFEITYLDGETVTTRLNETFGVFGWSFKILEEGEFEDERWCRGRLEIYKRQQLSRLEPANDPDELGREIVTEIVHTAFREQYGSQKIKRSRSSGSVMDIGFDMKGAATDCLKKCASLAGVGLYLWSKDEGAIERAIRAQEEREAAGASERPQRATQGRSGARPASGKGGPVINGIQMPAGFRPPFILDLKSELPDDACRAKGCPDDVPDDESYTVNGHQVTGVYVKERSEEEVGAVLCPSHLTAWVAERKRVQAPDEAA